MSKTITQAFKILQSHAAHWTNEEEVRVGFLAALSHALGAPLEAERNHRDSSFNNLVIEFKAPGAFKGNAFSEKFDEALNRRLLPYILKLAYRENINPNEFIGIATDGMHVGFAHVQETHVHCGSFMPLDQSVFGMMVEALTLQRRRSLNTVNLIEDFGSQSKLGSNLVVALQNSLMEHLQKGGTNHVKMLFAEWIALFEQTTSNHSWTTASSIEASQAQLFALHTTHAVIIKLIAAEILGANGLCAAESFASEVLAEQDPSLVREKFKLNLENGLFFEQALLDNFVETSVFSWYTYVEDFSAISAALRGILTRLELYSFSTSSLDGHTQDVLRALYQNIVPEKIRKTLGEFYTPDWLVDFTLSRLDYSDKDWLSKRVLDPTCGSGSFLLAVLRKKRQAAAQHNLSPLEELKLCQTSVMGFDLNPLAVQTARVNFLIGIADLLPSVTGHAIEIPILLADAIYSPSPITNDNATTYNYKVGSEAANLAVSLPARLVEDTAKLNAVANTLHHCIERCSSFDDVIAQNQQLIDHVNLEKKEWELIRQAYDQIADLHRKNWNGIWFNIVRNFFRSVGASQFDAIVGNPPWVRWSALPETYRERAKPTCENYRIFSGTKYHGGNELDISAIITYSAANKWLKPDGEMLFLITQSVFQSPSCTNFRSFRLPSGECLLPVSVNDFRAVQPFPSVTTKTALAHFHKQPSGVDPYNELIPYIVWKRTDSMSARIPEHLHLDEVLATTVRENLTARPVQAADNTSPWAILSPDDFQSADRFLGASESLRGRKGVTADVNGLYFVDVLRCSPDGKLIQVRNRPQEGRTAIGTPRTFWCESQFVHPLIKGGADIRPCRLQLQEPGRGVIVPNQGIDKASFEEADRQIRPGGDAPRLYSYFSGFESVLRDRSTYRLRMKDAPFFSIYNVGDYTFASWKVVWAEISARFSAAVAGSGSFPAAGAFTPRPFVPDHKLYFVEFDQPEPAYFLCALLNTPRIVRLIDAFRVTTSTGNILKHLRLPTFDPENPEHLAIAALCHDAHASSETDDDVRLQVLFARTERLLDELSENDAAH